MRLVDSSISLTAAFAASQTLFLSASSLAAASVLDISSENEAKQGDYSKSSSVGQECSFSNSYLKGTGADTGILGCGEPEYVCVEDALSSLGGRCAPANVIHRKLFNTTCTAKCTGDRACDGSLDPINIGDGSCCGYKACYGVSASSVIGVRSCIGFKACYKAQDANIGDGSCTGDLVKGTNYYGFSCGYLQGVVGDNSCFEYGACYQYGDDNKIFNIGNDSCRGQASCMYTGNYIIGNTSCNDYYACYQIYAGVGIGSCNANRACYKHSGGDVGNAVCNTASECEGNTGSVTSPPTLRPSTSAPMKGTTMQPSVSPTSKPIVSPTKKPTGSPTKKPTGSPTKKPTGSPTKKPTGSPTKKPTGSPTKKPTNAPTKMPTTKAPTSKPTTSRPTIEPTRISPSLLFSVDLCYPGCPNFEDLDTKNAFEDVIKTYTPCSSMQCVVDIVDSATSLCATCSIPASGRTRFLEDSIYGSSEVKFEIVSNTTLVQQEVRKNLNGNITNINNDLNGRNASILVISDFTAVTLQPTKKPSSSPINGKSSKKPSPSTKPNSKSSKDSKNSKKSSKNDKTRRMM